MIDNLPLRYNLEKSADKFSTSANFLTPPRQRYTPKENLELGMGEKTKVASMGCVSFCPHPLIFIGGSHGLLGRELEPQAPCCDLS